MDNSLEKETHTALGRALLTAIRAVRAADNGGGAGDAPYLLDQVTKLIAKGVAPATELVWEVSPDFPFDGGNARLVESGCDNDVVAVRMVPFQGRKWLAFDIPRGASSVGHDAHLEMCGVRFPVPSTSLVRTVQR